MTQQNEVPVAVVMEAVSEVKASLLRLDVKLDEKLGDHATRIARMEVEGEHQQRQITELQRQLRDSTQGRRWAVTTLIAVFAVLVAIGSLLAAILGG